MNRTERARLRLAAIPVTAYVLLMVLIAALWVKPPLAGWIFLGVVALVGAGLIAAAFVQRTRALVPSVDLIELERPADADSWTSIDKTKLSPAERRFVEDDVEGAPHGRGDPGNGRGRRPESLAGLSAEEVRALPLLTGFDSSLATTLLALFAAALMVQVGLGKRRLRWRKSSERPRVLRRGSRPRQQGPSRAAVAWQRAPRPWSQQRKDLR
jgi:hypothetical protein